MPTQPFDMQQVSENLYLAPEGVLIFCHHRGQGGGFDTPFRGFEKFFERLLAKFPDSTVRPLVNRYVQLGWMREQSTSRMKGFNSSQEEIDIARANVTVFLDNEEKQYIALGYIPISFDGYNSDSLDEYKKLLLKRAAVRAES